MIDFISHERRTVNVTNTNLTKDNAAAPKATAPRSRTTRAQFCELEGISLSTYHKLRHTGYGPVETFLPGTRIVHVTAKAHSDWCKAMEKWNRSKAARLEQQRRLVLVQTAANKSVASRRKAKQEEAKKTITKRR